MGGLRSAAVFTWLAGSPGGGGGRRGARRALEQPPSVTAARQRGRACGPGGPRLPPRKAAPAASSGSRLPASGARAAERRPGTPRRPRPRSGGLEVGDRGGGGRGGPGLGVRAPERGPRRSGRDPGRGAVLGSGAGGSPRSRCEWVGAGVGAGLGRRALEPDGFPGVASGQAPRPGRGKGARPRGGGGGGV